LYPFKVLTTGPDSFTIQNPGKRVARGESLLVYADYCASEHQSPRVETLIEQDGRVMMLDPKYPAATFGCHKATVPLITIPRVMALESTSAAGTGKARLQIVIRYRINALREVQYNFTTDEFIIDP
jgi:hypothetical protein